MSSQIVGSGLRRFSEVSILLATLALIAVCEG